MSNKGKTMKGVRTVGGKPQQGWDLFFFSFARGAGAAATRKGPECFTCTKDGALFVTGEDFLSQRSAAQQHRSRFLPPRSSASACLPLSLTCFSTVSACKEVGRKTEEEKREDKERRLWDYVREALICVG